MITILHRGGGSTKTPKIHYPIYRQPLTQVTEAITWVRCASGNVLIWDHDYCHLVVCSPSRCILPPWNDFSTFRFRVTADFALWRKPHWKWSIKEFAKVTTPHFWGYELFQIRYLGNNIWSVSLSSMYLGRVGYELKPYFSSTKIFTKISWSSGRLAEGCEKVRVQLNKTALNICNDPGEKKYLWNICPEKGWFVNFFVFYFFLDTI